MNYPSLDEAKSIHRKYAPSETAYELVFTHSQIVWDIAKQLIDDSKADIDSIFMQAACLLHDIGAYRMYMSNGELDHKNYIQHGIRGYELLKEEGFDERLCRIASHHTGVGLTKEQIAKASLPLPDQDFMAECVEERLVMYADKFHTKSSPPRFMTINSYREFTRKFDEQNAARFNKLVAEFGEPDIGLLATKYKLEVM